MGAEWLPSTLQRGGLLRVTTTLVAVVLAFVLQACATEPTVSALPDSRTSAPAPGSLPAPSGGSSVGLGAPARGWLQEVHVATEPSGAACTVLQGSAVVASIPATPSNVTVRRQPEARYGPLRSIEIVCRKEGYLVERATYEPEHVDLLRRLGEFEETATDEEKAAATMAVGAQLLGPVLASVPIPGVAIAGLGLQLIGLGGQVTLARPAFVYRPMPVHVLVREKFESDAERDAFFAELRAGIEAAGSARRERIDRTCFYFPCRPEDGACPDPYCEERRKRVSDEVRSRIDQALARRPETRLEPP